MVDPWDVLRDAAADMEADRVLQDQERELNRIEVEAAPGASTPAP